MEGANDSLPVRILFDNSLYRFTNSDDVVVRWRTVNLGGIETEIRLAEVEARQLTDWRATEASALQAICNLARAGKVRFCISLELHLEFIHSPESFRSARTGNELLQDIEFDFIDSPIERSRFLPGGEFDSKPARMAFCQWLRGIARKNSHIDWAVVGRGAIPPQEIEALNCVSRYEELCVGLSDSDEKMIDVLHLWTAEVANIPYFMTYDRRLVNFMSQTSRVELKCQPMSPSKLYEQLPWV